MGKPLTFGPVHGTGICLIVVAELIRNGGNLKMSVAELQIGKKWSHLEVVDSGIDYHTVIEEPGFTEKEKDTWYDLQCTCGQTIRVWEKDWWGVKHVKDCGCGVAELDGMTVILSASVPMTLKQQVLKYAIDNHLNRSQAVRDLLRVGLEVAGGAY